MRRISLLIPILLLAVPAVGQEPQQARKAAWAYTLEERISLRTDAAAARERVRQDAAKAKAKEQSETRGEQPQARPTVDVFYGSRNPELFLPTEVFDGLLRRGFRDDPRRALEARDELMPDVRRYGLPSDFWLRLESVSAAYLSDYRSQLDFLSRLRSETGEQRRRREQELEQRNEDLCRSRADALTAARREFGQERFDRFLYEVIVFPMFSARFDKLQDAETLRKIERGCR